MNVVRKSQLKIVERLGAGRFGEAHLCYFIGIKSSALVVVKSLDPSSSFEMRLVYCISRAFVYFILVNNEQFRQVYEKICIKKATNCSTLNSLKSLNLLQLCSKLLQF